MTNVGEQNLLALAAKDPGLSMRLRISESDAQVDFATSKSGQPVLRLFRAGHLHPLHSMVDPVREGLRFHEANPVDGFLVMFGMGCGYHIAPYLEDSNISQILIVDFGLNTFRNLLDQVDLVRLLLDARVQILIDPQPSELRDYVVGNYLPAVSGKLSTLSLRTRTEIDQQLFYPLADAVRDALEILSDDFTVQSQFGRRWFINTLLNLKQAQSTNIVCPTRRTAVVVGAGPGLESGYDEIRALQKSATLIATDTSLPALLAQDLVPDVVLSIDCQHISYLHFMRQLPPSTILVLDLASPHVLARIAPRTAFFSSGHPFSRYLAQNWRAFPQLDTSGGNVTHAAVSIAERSGAKNIHLFGADFSYPAGKTYARDTYVYPYFSKTESRLRPMEQQSTEFLFRSPVLIREPQGAVIRYTTRFMVSYRDRLADMLSQIPAQTFVHRVAGLEIPVAAREPARDSSGSAMFAAGPVFDDWKAFLNDFRTKIQELPPIRTTVAGYFINLDHSQRMLWLTLFPSLAFFRQHGTFGAVSPGELMESTRSWAVSRISSLISAE